MPKLEHKPVLIGEVLELLRPSAGEAYLDLTAGYGGHAAVILAKTQAPDKAVLVDWDATAIAALKARFGEAVPVIQSDFLSASQQLAEQGSQFDIILADLGVSSVHLDQPERGFSFRVAAPLDMRQDQRQSLTAYDIVNKSDESHLAGILSRLGEEPKAKQIAKAIVKQRPVKDTAELAAIAASVWPGYNRKHPATRTFQAIRLAVNDELGQLTKSLAVWLDLLAPGGRLAVISFHSLEDRLVKAFLAEHAGSGYDADLQLLNKKPVVPSVNEIANNPRARSAKLRAAAKQK